MKFKAVLETEVYRSDAGYICIAQKHPAPGVEDQCVLLSNDQALLVAREITRLANRTVWDPLEDPNLAEPGEESD